MEKVRSKDLGFLFVVGGPGGSGSSTIASMLAEHFKLDRVYAGQMFRDLVRDYGYEELDGMYTTLPLEDIYEFDRVVDEEMIKKSQEKNILIEAKAFAALATKKNIPCTVKIWLTAKENIRVSRSLMKKSKNPFLFIFEYFKTRRNLRERMNSDRQRYRDLYGIDYDNPKKYNDIVIDSSNINVKKTFNLILKKLEDGGYLK